MPFAFYKITNFETYSKVTRRYYEKYSLNNFYRFSIFSFKSVFMKYITASIVTIRPFVRDIN